MSFWTDRPASDRVVMQASEPKGRADGASKGVTGK